MPCYFDILQYVKNQQYLELATENDKRTLKRLAMSFLLDGESLYKKGKDQMLLRCVDAVKAKKILKEINEGIYGTHVNRYMMA